METKTSEMGKRPKNDGHCVVRVSVRILVVVILVRSMW